MFEVNLFGKFRMTYRGSTLNQDEVHSEMIIKLLSYILIYRDRLVPVNELADVLWGEEDAGNPGGALKNLMYRMRNVLKSSFGDGDFILNSRGAYCWNKQYAVQIDCEIFEKLNQSVDKTIPIQQKKESLEKAIALYKGDFLSGYATMQWIVPLSTYYHSMFLTAVKKLTTLYQNDEDYEQMERVSAFALQFDASDETLHCQLVRALVYQNKHELANEYFARAEKIVNNSVGIYKSEELREVQNELIRMQTVYNEAGLKDVSESIAESEEPEGAYICSYPIFREIYRLECRRVARKGEDTEYILLLTLSLRKEAASEDNEQYNQYQMNRAMGYLDETLREALRISDVAAKYSNSQYVVLLPLLGYQDCQAVARRITKCLYSKVSSKKIEVKSDISGINGNALDANYLDFAQ